MKPTHIRAGRNSALALIAVAAMMFAPGPAGGAPPVSPSAPAGSDLSAVPKEVTTDSQGAVQQVVPKDLVPAPSGTPAEAPAAAQAHAPGVHKALSGNGDTAGDLVVESVFQVGEGSTVRLRQEIDKVQVFGASAAQSLTADGALISVTGALAKKSKGKFTTTTPTAQVQATALKKVAEQSKTAPDKLAVDDTKAFWYDAKLAAKDEAQSVAVPAFKVEINGASEDKNGEPAKWIVFVDANSTNKVLDSWSETKHLNRVVCDNANRRIDPNRAGCGTGTLRSTRSEGQAPVGIKDVDDIYTYLGNTEAFYAKYTKLANLTNLIGSDTGDGKGKALRATVRLCTTTACPYQNAFWSGSYMAYGSGLTTEDITGHELTHGVTQHTNGLVYRNEPGAINESMSDIFGELTFLVNTSNPCNTAANRWKLGACSSIGVIRDMKNPNAYQDPDTYRGRYWYTGTGDSGGVHINSGVGNKTAQLMVDGGSLNSVNVTAIGLEKTAALYWTTQTLLTSNSNYAALSTALKNACNTNVRNGTAGTTAADCVQVANATKATKLPQQQTRT
ncbi:M4 family metallopeptidase [Nocardia sp. CS682]|uniref:M4 family metallopeptidase n=1 Tax=Nocardia sp. CS682 TaxID=1047172 RepID=UPI0014312840|nr:M4 family metallopeptidase [Nocardia sp. CS682]